CRFSLAIRPGGAAQTKSEILAKAAVPWERPCLRKFVNEAETIFDNDFAHDVRSSLLFRFHLTAGAQTDFVQTPHAPRRERFRAAFMSRLVGHIAKPVDPAAPLGETERWRPAQFISFAFASDSSEAKAPAGVSRRGYHRLFSMPDGIISLGLAMI